MELKILTDENNQFKFDFTNCKYVIELHKERTREVL